MAELAKIIKGTDFILFVKSGATELPIAFSTSCKLDIKTSMREIKTKDNVGDWNESLPDKMSYSLSTEGLFATRLSGSTLGADTLIDMQLAKLPLTFTMSVKNGTSPYWTSSTSNIQLKGTLIIETYGITAGDGDMSFSVSFIGTGPIVKVNGI